MSRYVIGEVRGFAKLGVGGNRPGLSVVVTDSLDNQRIMGQFRSEERGSYGRGRYLGDDEARRRARELVARLELPGAVGSGAACSQGTAAPGPPGKGGSP